jgi:hypothetical protein
MISLHFMEKIFLPSRHQDTKDYVEARIRYLRDKIDKNFLTKLIYTVRGVGYVLKQAEEYANIFRNLLFLLLIALSFIPRKQASTQALSNRTRSLCMAKVSNHVFSKDLRGKNEKTIII